jgi:hypothetical protein
VITNHANSAPAYAQIAPDTLALQVKVYNAMKILRTSWEQKLVLFWRDFGLGVGGSIELDVNP